MELKTIILNYLEDFLINELNFKSINYHLNFYDLSYSNNDHTILISLEKSEGVLIEVIKNNDFLDSKLLPLSFDLLENIKKYISKNIF